MNKTYKKHTNVARAETISVYDVGLLKIIKVAIFIDAAHVGEILKKTDVKIDFKKLNDVLSEGMFRVRTYYYTCMPFQSTPPTKEERQFYQKIDKFHHVLNNMPRFQVKLKRMQKIKGREKPFQQKGVDMQLGVDLASISTDKQIDRAIIIASDSDFVYPVEKAKDAGVVTTLAYFPNSKINTSLLQVVDEKIELDADLISKCRRVWD